MQVRVLRSDDVAEPGEDTLLLYLHHLLVAVVVDHRHDTRDRALTIDEPPRES